MTFYIVIALILTLFSKFRYNGIIYILLFLMLLIISAGRDISVGTDTQNYFNAFIGTIASPSKPFEISWRFLMNNSPSYFFLKLISSLLILLPIFYVSKKESVNPYYSILLFVLLYYFCNSFNVTRQYVSYSILFLSFFFFIRKKYLFTIILGLFALTFHTSAIVPFLLFPLSKIKLNYIITPILIILTFFVGALNLPSKFLSYLTIGVLDIYDVYFSANISDQSFSLSRLLLNILIIFMLLLLKNKSPYFNLVVVGCIIINLLSFSPTIGRISQFFLMAQIIVIPNISLLFVRKYNQILKIFCFIYAWTVFVFFLYNNVGEVVPYSFSLY